MVTIKEDITDIKVSVGKIEEHLKMMNGAMVRFNKHIQETCPTLHKEIDKVMYKAMGIFSFIMFLINIGVIFYINH